MVEMLELLVPDPSDVSDKVSQLLADLFAIVFQILDPGQQLPDLSIVVLANLGLDSLCAGHGGFSAHDCGSPSECCSSDLPDRIESSRADAMLGYDLIEVSEMAFFLIVHVLHERSQMRMGFDEWRGLGRVDEDGSQLSGLIHSQLKV